VKFRVLSATADSGEWDGLFERLPKRLQDVHFTSAYGRIQEIGNAGKVVLAVLERGSEIVMQPFGLNPIRQTGLFDITSLYGYGGPIGDVGLSTGFQSAVSAWYREIGIVSEYCALHPLFAEEQAQLLDGAHLNHSGKAVFVIDLEGFSEASVSRHVRRGARKARTEATVFDSRVENFWPYYQQAMKDKAAADRWILSFHYFLAHKAEVGARWVGVARFGGDAGARVLLVIGVGENAYAHFLGSDGAAKRGGLDDLLYVDTALYLKRLGFKRFHLGGGLSDARDDTLLAYKASFGGRRLIARRLHRILNPAVYRKLELKTFEGEQRNHGRLSNSKWFPIYRRAFV
jgi:hypothetical protein